MSRILVYCGFRHAPELALPAVGVNAAPVQVAAMGDLRLLWSEVEWPFDPQRMQKSAVEFHEVVHQVFKQTAVIPFRLLSVFEDQQAFTAFAEENHERFLQDLNRLKDFVQMECVIYPKPRNAGGPQLRQSLSGTESRGIAIFRRIRAGHAGCSGPCEQGNPRTGRQEWDAHFCSGGARPRERFSPSRDCRANSIAPVASHQRPMAGG